MRILRILGASLFLILINTNYAYASVVDEVNSSKTILNIGTGIILGFVTLGLTTTAAGWLLDIAQKQKLRIYMEILSYLLGMLVVIGFFITVYRKVLEVSNM